MIKQGNPRNVMKFCPRCGAGGFRFQEDNSFVCGGCGFHYYINSAAAVAALIENSHGELLFTVRAREPGKGLLDLPGGFADAGETAEAALQREIREELDIGISDIEYVCSFPNTYLFGGYTYYTLDLAFRCRTDEMNGMRLNDEIAGIVFITPEDVDMDRVAFSSIREIVRKYVSGRNA